MEYSEMLKKSVGPAINPVKLYIASKVSEFISEGSAEYEDICKKIYEEYLQDDCVDLHISEYRAKSYEC